MGAVCDICAPVGFFTSSIYLIVFFMIINHL